MVVVFDALLLLLLLLLLAVELVAGEWGNIRAKLPRLLCSSMVSTSTRRSSGVITSSIVPMLACSVGIGKCNGLIVGLGKV